MPVSDSTTLTANTWEVLALPADPYRSFVEVFSTASAEFRITGPATELGTATFAQATDRWTLNDHGLAVDDVVVFTTEGTNPTEYDVDVPYYVVGVIDANVFELSATKGGAPLTGTIDSDGTWTLTKDPAAFDLGDNNWGIFAANGSRVIPAPARGAIRIGLKSSGTPTVTATSLGTPEERHVI